jgi:phenylpyruvate tautomerase PptA (4-oxalocrotonate tautomerase family)
MPLLKVQTSVEIADEKDILTTLSKAVAETTGKPEKYVMVTLEKGSLLMAAEMGDAAFVEVHGIGGIGGETNKKLSQRICGILNDKLSIPENRTYINFFDIPASDWGWNSSTFG